MHKVTFLRFSILGIAALLIVGCSSLVPSVDETELDTQLKIDAPRTVTLSLALTQCNDAPWELAGYRSEDVVYDVTAFLQERHNSSVDRVEVVPAEEGAVFCSACGCPTGDTVYVTVGIADEDVLTNLGFTHDDTLESDVSVIEFDETDGQPLTEEVVQEIEEQVEAATADDAEESTETSELGNDGLTEEQQALVEAVVETEVETQEEANVQDQFLETTAGTIQNELANYYSTNGSYPESLEVLPLSGVDLTPFSYTPIGSSPATYYDLSVLYTTGRQVLNP